MAALAEGASRGCLAALRDPMGLGALAELVAAGVLEFFAGELELADCAEVVVFDELDDAEVALLSLVPATTERGFLRQGSLSAGRGALRSFAFLFFAATWTMLGSGGCCFDPMGLCWVR